MMPLNEHLHSEINRLIQIVSKDQSIDGSWKYAFETGIITDAYMIILLRLLEIDDEELISQLVQRIISRQEKNGAWKLSMMKKKAIYPQQWKPIPLYFSQEDIRSQILN
ncbi:hypothetical protein [Halobacillus mangrovi]|uniref:hypothetical protein n=1 Tax=Halobacillus mangrovi TaxID=402384 RepID=UPI002FC29E41